MVCPYCDAPLDYSLDRKMIFCTYCGGKLLIDDEVQKTEQYIRKDINYHHTYTDEAKVKKIDAQNQQKMKELENEQKNAEIFSKHYPLMIGGAVIMIIVLALLAFVMR